MSADPAGVQAIWDDVIDYKCREREWLALDKLEHEAIVTAQHQPEPEIEFDEVDDIGLDEDGELLELDTIFGGSDE